MLRDKNFKNQSDFFAPKSEEMVMIIIYITGSRKIMY